MIRFRTFAELMLLAVLAISASPMADPEPAARVSAPDGTDPGLLIRATLVMPLPAASESAKEARREPASKTFEALSGGPTGTLFIGAALVAAIALILAVVAPWSLPIGRRTPGTQAA